MQSRAIRQRDGLKIRREILQRIKSQVQMYLGVEPPALRTYALAYKKDIERSRWKVSDREELRARLLAVDVVFGGDFHAFAQAQRVHLRNLREIQKHKTIVLALECVASKHQKILDRYMRGGLAEADFLKQIRWDKEWGFPWSQYKPLLDLVRGSGGRCVALDRRGGLRGVGALKERDQHAAKILSSTYETLRSHEMIYVVYGDLHIARERIPALFLKRKRKRKKTPQCLTVYLNPEKIYFQLFKKNQEHEVAVLKFGKNEFCLLESPPWVKWQSYLIFLEETIDAALGREDEDDEDDEMFSDFSEHVGSLLQVMSSDLGVRRDFEPTVYSFNDHDLLDILSEKMSASEFALAQQAVGQDISFYHPALQLAFLSRGTVNYAAHLAGEIFYSVLSERSRYLPMFPQDFPKEIWRESMAFFLSKLINPHRKALSLGDLKKQLAAFSGQDGGEEVLKIALDQKMKDLLWVYGEGAATEERPAPPVITALKAAKLLGAMMGDRIYRAHKAGLLSRRQLSVWLQENAEGDKFKKFYVQVLRDLDTMEAGESHG